MDADVLAAMARWPNVPAVYGWLALTARGQWRLRGEPIGNRAIVEFIARNYHGDERGRWFFQNGPQRVFVALALTPWIWRITDGRLRAHTGAAPRALRSAALAGDHLILATDLGPGAIDDRDLPALLPALVDATGAPLADAALTDWLAGAGSAWLAPQALGEPAPPLPIDRLAVAELPARFGFVRDPGAD